MDRKEIEAFEKAHHYILPESYINFLLICDNHPEKYCKGYRDIILYSLEELPEERKLYEMDEFCPEYIAIYEIPFSELCTHWGIIYKYML